MMETSNGQWVVLEVGTDGVFNHVERDLGDLEFESELNRRVAEAFWRAARGSGAEIAPSMA
jgi:hypothetical protein